MDERQMVNMRYFSSALKGGSHTPKENSMSNRESVPEKKTWTVIGFWYNDEPLVDGVIEGSHRVYGGDVDDVEELQGGWGYNDIEAETWSEAARIAVGKIRKEDAA
jgi:hypothetical protein